MGKNRINDTQGVATDRINEQRQSRCLWGPPKLTTGLWVLLLLRAHFSPASGRRGVSLLLASLEAVSCPLLAEEEEGAVAGGLSASAVWDSGCPAAISFLIVILKSLQPSKRCLFTDLPCTSHPCLFFSFLNGYFTVSFLP